jgi:predicted DNA-binding protein (MmcQ/YjbR family)
MIHVDEIREYCLLKPGATEDLPFDEVTLVVRVMGKIFALIPLDTPDRINLKCDPERAISLREHYQAVKPGFHMNKKHWNTVFLFQDAAPELIMAMIDHSYELIANALTRKAKDELARLQENQ